MSDTIIPWICPYLISVAQQYGASPHDAPLSPKGKKVQLIKFLTFEESQDAPIWARISDKSHFIPIRFSKEAIQDYYKTHQASFTSLKTAIISIKEFRPVFRRIPLGGKGGMSDDRALSLDCIKFQYIGSAGEDVFGSPVTVEKNLDVLEWSHGLSKDGGAGNVLKIRKLEEEAAANKALPAKTNIKQTIKNITTVQHPVRRPQPPKANVDPATAYEKSWVVMRKLQYRQPPAHIEALLETLPIYNDPKPNDRQPSVIPRTPVRRKPTKHPLDLDSSPALSPSSQSRAASASPGTVFSGWHPSPIPGAPLTDPISSQLSPPTPAQRSIENNQLLSSSPLSQPAVNETALPTLIPPATISPSSRARRSVTRKIPRPPQPILRLSSITSGRILVPNSDTSLSHSQSQGHSQPKDESSQPGYLSEPRPMHGPILPDQFPDKKSRVENLKKEKVKVYATDPGNEAGDEADNNHPDSPHDSLFSGNPSDSEDLSYDGDKSSLEPLRSHQNLYSQVETMNHRGQPLQSQDNDMSEDSIALSMVVHPATSQKQDEENLNTNYFKHGRNALALEQSIHTIHNMKDIAHGDGPRPEEQINVRDQLPEASAPAQPQTLQITSRPPNPPQLTNEDIPETPNQALPSPKSRSPTMSEIVSKTPRTGDQATEMSVIKPAIREPHTSTLSDSIQRHKNVIPHDAKAWLAPSFLRPSSSINIDAPSTMTSRSATSSKDHSNVSAKRQTPEEMSENLASNDRAPKRGVHPRGDQNSNPSMRNGSPSTINSKQNRSYHSSIKGVSSFTRESSQSRPQKRGRDSEHTSQTSADSGHKRRKTNQAQSITAQPTTASMSDQKGTNTTKLLGGWQHGLDQPVVLSILDDANTFVKNGVVSWVRLKDICLCTGRRRESEDL